MTKQLPFYRSFSCQYSGNMTSITNHKLYKKILQGNTDQRRFKFYLAQDEIYLNENLKIAKNLRAQYPNVPFFKTYVDKTTRELDRVVRMTQNHNLQHLYEAIPANLAYQHFLKDAKHDNNPRVSIARFLPCLFIFPNIIETYKRNQETIHPHLFSDWWYSYNDCRSLEQWLDRTIMDLMNGVTTAEWGKMDELIKEGFRHEQHFADSIWKTDLGSLKSTPKPFVIHPKTSTLRQECLALDIREECSDSRLESLTREL